MRKLLLMALLAALALPASAQAAFPGNNGKIAFVRGGDIWTTNPDGSGQVNLTNSAASELAPAWSPDGQKIAFNRAPAEIVVMNANGTGQTSLGAGHQPSWSPDGSKIVFVEVRPCGDGGGVYTMNADGTGRTFLACEPAIDPGTGSPVWSPNGALVAFTGDRGAFDIFTVRSDGTDVRNLTNSAIPIDDHADWAPDALRIAWDSETGADIWAMDRFGFNKTNLTNDAAADDREPAYSPDGTRIVFFSDSGPLGLHVMSSTGGPATFVAPGESPDWQAIPINAYPRPRGATPMRIPLVPAYNTCSSPNSTHGAPLGFPSCNPPVLTSQYLTVGTPDANGKRTTMEAFILLRAVPGIDATPADEADVRITARINNVFNKNLTDYTGGLAAWFRIQITDRRNSGGPGGPGAGTMFEIPILLFTMNCAADPDPQIGSECSVTTTVDAMFPGTVTEGDRAVWQIGKVEVYDGGSDGDPITNPITGGNTLFAVQGVFVP